MKNFSKDSLQLGVIGAGVMGRGIAQVAVVAGLDVVLFDANTEACKTAAEFVAQMLDRAAAKGRMSGKDAAAAKQRLRVVSALQDLSGADLIIEAIVERLEVKQDLFKQLEALVTEQCILASNTSSLSITEIAAACRKPARIAGCHFFNPVPLMPLVEVVHGERTAPKVVEQLLALVKRIGHTPIRVGDSPGFLVNHAGRGLGTEGLRILFENVATPVDVDRIMRDCAGFRMGPFELMDLTGLDVSWPVSQQVYQQFFHDPRLRPTPLLQRRFNAGLFGRKGGGGFYQYDGDRKIEPPEESLPRRGRLNWNNLIWVSGAVPDLAKRVKAVIKGSGARLDSGKKPKPKSIALVTPLGWDATTAALREKCDPARTVAVDAVLSMDTRVTLMGNPAVDWEVVEAAADAFARANRKVTVIRDSAGFVAQRIIATIINIACDIAQQGIATPADIDTGARLGLGYPAGPLAMGDAIGPDRIMTILEHLRGLSGDPRYRASPWLRRRAQLKLSLLHVEK